MPKYPVRERLLDAADAVMFIEGAVGTPVDQILKVAGASPASLYGHFGSKDGLVAAALERRLVVWTAVWDEALAAATTDVERLLSVFTAMRTYHDERMAERWCAFHGTAAAIRDPSPAVLAPIMADRELLSGRLLELARPIANDRAAELADHLVVAYSGMLALMLRNDPHQAMEQAERTARFLVSAYATTTD
ncbi:TetR/AcrR family transcriptional regulator [Mariniluteicoccus endophyticus]